MKFSSFVKEKTAFVLDESKFHVGCAYFVQWNAKGGSWFTGILNEVNEKNLIFVIRNGEIEYIDLDELRDPNNNYSITLLVPTDDDYLVSMVKRENPKGYDRYIGR
jgi:hypothetical protein